MIIPPFAEEMNKSRRMFTDVAESLAMHGIATVLPDLYGTGDSAGEFRDADWEVWKDDLACAASWAAASGWPVTALLCVRLGCALGAQAVTLLRTPIDRTVFWQPILDGERFLTQFLRLKVAASMMEDRRESVVGLRAQLRAGDCIEIAGYELMSRLAEQIGGIRLVQSLNARLGRLHWLELVPDDGGPLTTASEQAILAARSAGCLVKGETIAGEPFWSAAEVVRIPRLVERTVEVLTAAA